MTAVPPKRPAREPCAAIPVTREVLGDILRCKRRERNRLDREIASLERRIQAT